MTGRYERELVALLEDYGFAVIRTPTSGSATSRPLPDLTAARSPLDHGAQDLWALEAKTRSDRNCYLGPEEVENLLSFADTGGYTAFIACRWKSAPGWKDHCKTWFLKHPLECERTDSGNYKLTRPATPRDWQGYVLDPDEATLEASDAE